MYCRKCGKKLEEEDRYCPYCGEKTIRHDMSGDSPDVLKAVEQLKAGDEQGFNSLYFSTYNFVYSRARYILNDNDEALDLVQEVYLALYNDIGSLKDDSKVYSWIGTVTFRQAMKILRKNKKQVLLPEEAEGMFDRIQDDELTPEEGVMDTQDVDVIQGCISKLSPEQKAVILAYYFDGMKVDDIAAVMEISEGTVKSRLYLARKNLKKLILEQEEKQGYRLHVFGAPALIFVLKGMLKDTKLSETEAKREYRKIADSIGDGIIDEAAGKVASKAADEIVKKAVPAGSVAKKTATVGSVAKKAAVMAKVKLVLAFAGVAAAGTGIGFGAVKAVSSQNNSNETTPAIIAEETIKIETAESIETIEMEETVYESETMAETQESSDSNNEEDVQSYVRNYYSGVLEEYKTVQSMGFRVNPEQYPHINRLLASYGMNGEELYYTTIDLCNDGIPELFIASVSPDDPTHYNIYDIYGFLDGNAVHLEVQKGDEALVDLDSSETMGNRAHYYICENNMIKETASGGALSYAVSFLQLRSDDIVLTYEMGISRYNDEYTKDDGWNTEYISESEYNEMENMYALKTDIQWFRLADFW